MNLFKPVNHFVPFKPFKPDRRVIPIKRQDRRRDRVGLVTAKNSHPAAGKLFVDYCLSEEGQTVLKGLSRITVRKDVLPNPPKLIQGHKLLAVNPVSPDDYNRYNNEYHKYFR